MFENQPVPYLTMLGEPQQPGRVYPLTPGRTLVIGRGIAADISVKDVRMSRTHCEIVAGETGALIVRDLASTNGIFVNGNKIHEAHLKDGDLILVGRTKFEFHSAEHRLVTASTGAAAAPLDETTPKDFDFAGIAEALAIEPSPPEQENSCAVCRREVARREIKSGAATCVHGQICCPQCIQSDSLINKTISGFRLDTRLGGGLWCAAYKAEQLSMARSVVLRVINAKWLNDGELAAKFLAAVKRGGQLSHPNLVRLYDIGRIESSRYICVEFIDGDSAKRRVFKKQMQIDEAVEALRSIAGAVEIAHRRGICHHDIRPANILFNADNVPKLVGLGFAQGIEETATARVRIPHAAEDIAYRAPEQLTGKAGPSADIYSLGAVLYFMLSSRAPFEVAAPEPLVRAILTEQPAPLGELRRGVSPALSAAIAKAMSKNPAERYRTCLEFISAIAE